MDAPDPDRHPAPDARTPSTMFMTPEAASLSLSSSMTSAEAPK